MLIFFGILLFVLLVVIHEFGHYLAARISGVKVEEFGIGFPPRAAGKRFKKGGTMYSLNWLPLGGFVKLKGEHDADKSPGSYGAAPLGKKAFILLAGVAMNLIAAALILSVISFSGMPRLVDDQFAVASDTEIIQSDVLVTYVVEGSPADQAGIETGDKLVSIDGQAVDASENLPGLTESYSGQTAEIVYASGGDTTSRDVRLNAEDSQDGFLGVSTGDFIVERSTWSAPIRGVALTGQFTWLTLDGLATTIGSLFSGQGSEAAANVAGPVGIVVLLSDISQSGINFVLTFIALISVTLAVINVLPVPALDGGRLFVTWLFRVLRKPLTPSLEEKIHATGMAVLMGLVILITVIDVRRFF